jgi:hypothetical protein
MIFGLASFAGRGWLQQELLPSWRWPAGLQEDRLSLSRTGSR